MSAVVRAFRAHRSRSRPWQNHELAEFYRVIDVLGRAGLAIVPDMGISDEGEPWFAFCRADTGEVVVHCARIDGSFIATSIASSEVFYGNELRDLVGSILKSKHFATVTPIADRRLYLHPAAIFTAFIAAALLMSQHAHAADSDSTPASPTGDGAALLKFLAAIKGALTDGAVAGSVSNAANEPVYVSAPDSFDAPISLGALMAATLAVLPVSEPLGDQGGVSQGDTPPTFHLNAAAPDMSLLSTSTVIHDTTILPTDDAAAAPVFGSGNGVGGGAGGNDDGGTGGIEPAVFTAVQVEAGNAAPSVLAAADSSGELHFTYIPAPSLHNETFAVMEQTTSTVQQTLTPAGHVFDISQISLIALEIFIGSPVPPAGPGTPPPTDSHSSNDASDPSTPTASLTPTVTSDNSGSGGTPDNSNPDGGGNGGTPAATGPADDTINYTVSNTPPETTASTTPAVINMASNPTLGLEQLVDYALAPHAIGATLHESALLAATLGAYAAGGEALPVLVVFDSATVNQSIFTFKPGILFVDDHELGIGPAQAAAANLTVVDLAQGGTMTLLGVVEPVHAVF